MLLDTNATFPYAGFCQFKFIRGSQREQNDFQHHVKLKADWKKCSNFNESVPFLFDEWALHFSVSGNGWTVGAGTVSLPHICIAPHMVNCSLHLGLIAATSKAAARWRHAWGPFHGFFWRCCQLGVNITTELGEERVIMLAACSAQNILLLPWLLQINNI